MPWLEMSLMDQRTQFIADYQRGLQTVTELAGTTVVVSGKSAARAGVTVVTVASVKPAA